MRFRTRITITYSILVLFLAFIFGIAYYNYNSKVYVKTEYDNLRMMAVETSQKFEETIKPMEFISEYLLSDIEVLNAIFTLARVGPDSVLKHNYITEAESDISLKLNSYYITKNFHRVLVYNSFGNVVASNNFSNNIINTDIKLEDLKWLSQVVGKKGNPILVGIRGDEWSKKNPEDVFSIVKEIQGDSLGFIEVQQKASELEDKFSITNANVDVIAVKSDGEILYSSQKLDKNGKSFYSSVVKDMKNEIREWKNPVNNKTQVISSNYSKISNLTVLLIKDVDVMNASLTFGLTITVFIAGCIFLASLGYIFIVSGLLTKPIRQLKGQMEKTELENLDEKIIYDKSNDEIAALSKSYQKALTRLNEEIIKERRMSLLQLKAQYDSLQAQVNPHFIYNVLNVISYRGLINKDEIICDMCNNLASMLRYSTNTKEKESSISNEIEYLKQYFYLLKKRYLHKLEFSIDIDKKIEDQVITKIVLQQIVENSITHGLANTTEIMEIVVTGWEENGRWYLKVCDNGQGFSKEVLNNLENLQKEVAKKLINSQSNIELEIGGMGLINTYARLFLLYGDDLVFILANNDYGAEVTIGAPMQEKKEEI